jgi:hypothetical protein
VQASIASASTELDSVVVDCGEQSVDFINSPE